MTGIEAWLRRLEARAAEQTGEDPGVTADLDRRIQQLLDECKRVGIEVDFEQRCKDMAETMRLEAENQTLPSSIIGDQGPGARGR